jgi:hypothetical protein
MIPQWRKVSLSVALVLSAVCTFQCTNSSENEPSGGDLTNIPVSGIRDQGRTGNCWLYGTVAWAESLATDERGPKNYSVAYLAYWNFFDQIRQADEGFGGVSWTGGTFGGAADIASRYGMVDLDAFVRGASADEKGDSRVALAAMQEVNQSLRTGALKTKLARSDLSLVRKELDRAWKVPADVARAMTQSFGEDGMRTFLVGAEASAPVMAPSAVPVRTIKVRDFLAGDFTPEPVRATLADVLGQSISATEVDARRGLLAWNSAVAPKVAPSINPLGLPHLRTFLRRAQRALHNGVPVPFSWCVVDTGKDPSGRYSKPVSGNVEPCGHQTVLIDYEVLLADGRTLKAGEVASQEDQALALDERAEIVFLRLKNSWGTTARGPVAGYTDIYPAYYLSAVQSCAQGSACDDWPTLLSSMALPPGF